MTYEEAKMQIQAIPEKIWDQLSEPDREAMEMAFSALQAQEAKTQLSAEGTTSDLISRQEAIDAIVDCTVYGNADELEEAVMQGNDWNRWSGGVLEALEAVKELPSSQPEIIRCRDCKYWREHKYAKETKRYIPFCGYNAIYTKSDDFCSKAERRTDGVDN